MFLQIVLVLLVLVVIGLLAVIIYSQYHTHLKLKLVMASQEEFQAQLDRIDSATNNIAADIRGIKDLLAGAGLPASVEDEVFARLTAAADKLDGIAAETPEDGGELPPDEN